MPRINWKGEYLGNPAQRKFCFVCFVLRPSSTVLPKFILRLVTFTKPFAQTSNCFVQGTYPSFELQEPLQDSRTPDHKGTSGVYCQLVRSAGTIFGPPNLWLHLFLRHYFLRRLHWWCVDVAPPSIHEASSVRSSTLRNSTLIWPFLSFVQPLILHLFY